jgi:hypothetical protein
MTINDLQHLKMTAEEKTLMAWCYENLDEENIVEIQEQALRNANVEINEEEAADRLLTLLTTVIVRNGREQS